MRQQGYEWIHKWGRLLGSHQSYIDSEVDRARVDKAPENAIYQHADGTWATTDDITSEDTRRQLGLPPLPAARRAALRREEAADLRRKVVELEREADEIEAKGD